MPDLQPPPLPDRPPFPNRQTFGQRVKQMLAPIAVALAAAGKWVLPVLKFGLPLLKMGGFMFVSLWAYAMFYGWPFAAGFILLIFIHEMGHLIAARMVGLKVGLPVFIPFMGAVIALKEAPRNAWIEAIVGIGGPLLGSLGALAVAPATSSPGTRSFSRSATSVFFSISSISSRSSPWTAGGSSPPSLRGYGWRAGHHASPFLSSTS